MSLFDLLQHTEVANSQSKNTDHVAQRPLNIPHATGLAKYLLGGLLYAAYNKRVKLGNPTDGKMEELMSTIGKQPYYAIAPIVASLRNCQKNGTNIKVVPLKSLTDETAAYKIFLSQADVLWVVDGQHRRKGAEIVIDFLKYISTYHKYPARNPMFASKTGEELNSEEMAVWNECLEQSKLCTINIEVHLGLDVDQEQQLFHDLNNKSKKVEKSIAFAFDSSNAVNAYIKNELINKKFVDTDFEVHEKDQSDWSKSGLSRKELIAINAVLFMNKSNILNAVPATVEDKGDIPDKFWDVVLEIPNMLEETAKQLTVAAQPVVLKAIAKLYFDFFFGKHAARTEENQKKLMVDILNVDFSHNNPMWQYYTMTPEERGAAGLAELAEYLPSDDEGKNRDLGAYDANAGTFRFGAKHNDIYPVIGDMIRWKLGLPSRKK